MGLFDRFKRKPAPPADLRKALIEAAGREDWKAFAALCQKHRAEIRSAFAAWTKLPDDIMGNAAACDAYARGLVAVASFFQNAGDPSLMAALTGNEADNPVIRWEKELGQANTLLSAGRAGEAASLLESTLARTNELAGPGRLFC